MGGNPDSVSCSGSDDSTADHSIFASKEAILNKIESKRASFLRRLPSVQTNDSYLLLYSQSGLYPMQLVVPSAVRNAVSAATITFTASSMILCFFMVRFFFFEE